MGRLTQGIITGGIVAAVAGMVMKRSRRNNMYNRYMNTMINMMAKIGMFRIIGNSRFFRNLIRSR
ncbi:hypothetical protein [Tepidibacillus marianensis]|uniref:hypothetical protein n=1 Tax=Tepidibacillus marianensis TaxID=3131995 RepID=UPI0030D10B1C